MKEVGLTNEGWLMWGPFQMNLGFTTAQSIVYRCMTKSVLCTFVSSSVQLPQIVQASMYIAHHRFLGPEQLAMDKSQRWLACSGLHVIKELLL